MKRFVTYLYEYDRGLKTKNTGFIRVDIRERFVNMEICIRKFLRDGEEGDVYALAAQCGLHGIELGNIKVHNGQGDLRLQLLGNHLQGTEFSIEDVVGVGIRFHDQSYLASCWTDAYAEAIGRGAFGIWKKEVPKPEKMMNTDLQIEAASIPSLSHPDKQAEITPIKQESLEQKKSEKQVPVLIGKSNSQSDTQEPVLSGEIKSEQEISNFGLSAENKKIIRKNQGNAMKIVSCDMSNTNSDEKNQSKALYSYQKIDLPQIREIPGQDFHYERNAFLIHGFWNYGYLILKTEVENSKKKVSLGVPGVYERQEAAMAMVFGFPKFETFPQEIIETPVLKELVFTKEEVEKSQPPKEKSFGCWFVELDGSGCK